MQTVSPAASAGKQHPSRCISSGRDGPYFWDVDGNRLLDYTLGWGPLIAGNNHPHINAAVARQLERGYTFGAQHELEIRVARQIVDMVPGVEQVIFLQ